MLPATHQVSTRTSGLLQIKLASKPGLFRAFLMKGPSAVNLSAIFAFEETMSLCIVHNCFISVLHHAGPPLLWISISTGQPLTHNLCRKLPKSKRKTDNEQSPAFPTHPIPPTQPLGHQLLWAKLTLCCYVLLVCIPVGLSLRDTSEPCLYNMVQLSPCAQVMRLPEASSSSSSSPLGFPGNLIKSSLRL